MTQLLRKYDNDFLSCAVVVDVASIGHSLINCVSELASTRRQFTSVRLLARLPASAALSPSSLTEGDVDFIARTAC